jgi:tetratricopeptide (TPR) repeat protein
MRIDSTISPLNLLASVRAPGTSSSAATAGGFSFGPDFLLSLAGLGGSESGGLVGLLGTVASPAPPAPELAGTSRPYRFDLSAALAPRTNPTVVRKVSPEAEKAERELLKYVLELIDAGLYGAARNLLDQQLKINPTRAAVVHTLGTLELALRNYENAERFFRKADFLAPEKGFIADAENAKVLQQDDDAVFKRAQILVAGADTRADGVRLLTNLTDRSPGNTQARIALAENLFRMRDVVNGIRQYALAIETADKSELAQLEARFEQLAEIAPDASNVQRLLGRTQLRLEKFEAAARTLGLATKLSQDDPDFKADEARAYVGLGREALRSGDVAAAVGQFEHAKELDPVGADVRRAYAEGLLARGELRARLGNLTDAVVDLRRAATELGADGDEELRERLAAAAYSVGIKLEARRINLGEKVGDEAVAFQVAYDMDSSNTKYRDKLAATRYTIGNEYLAEAKYEDAAASFRRAYDLDRRSTTYKSAAINAYRLWGDDALATLQYDDAVEAFKSAYDIDHTDLTSKTKLAAAYNTRGLWHKENQRFRDAALDFREALALFPENTEYQDNFDSVRGYL